jgi:FkbM family methyltransferase
MASTFLTHRWNERADSPSVIDAPRIAADKRGMLNRLRRGLEKLVAPGSHLSYAQAGEDLVLDFLVGHAPSGFYVDVGGNDPVWGSNSYRFYRKGWRGIVIDANAEFAARYRRVRPRDHFVAACVSDEAREVDFHIFAESALSSISGQRLYDNDAHYRLQRTETLRTRPLTDLLDEAGAPDTFDFLSVDVEGHDEAVLRSLDLDRYRPRIILVELNGTHLDVGRVNDHPLSQLVGERGYAPIAIHWGNVFYRAA